MLATTVRRLVRLEPCKLVTMEHTSVRLEPCKLGTMEQNKLGTMEQNKLVTTVRMLVKMTEGALAMAMVSMIHCETSLMLFQRCVCLVLVQWCEISNHHLR
jgi:hypothetical protein